MPKRLRYFMQRDPEALSAVLHTLRDDLDPQTSDLDCLVEFDDLPPAEYAQAYLDLKEGLEALLGRT